MDIQKSLGLLGLKVEDKVTGYKGVVSSISFDLYGCIQAVVTPFVRADGKQEDSRWHDVARLIIIDPTPVMERPDFVFNSIPEKGPENKPIGKW